MKVWMTLWTILLALSGLSLTVLLFVIGSGCVSELKQMLHELKEHVDDAQPIGDDVRSRQESR